MKKSLEMKTGVALEISSGTLACKLNEYALLLAAQGQLQTALTYLANPTEVNNLNILFKINVDQKRIIKVSFFGIEKKIQATSVHICALKDDLIEM